MSKFKLIKEVSYNVTTNLPYNVYEIRIDDRFVDLLVMEDDENATKWYELYKEFWKPTESNIISQTKVYDYNLYIQTKIKYKVTRDLKCEKEYSIMIWKDTNIVKSRYGSDESVFEELPEFIEIYNTMIDNIKIQQKKVVEVMFED
jgi:hypothetical protein